MNFFINDSFINLYNSFPKSPYTTIVTIIFLPNLVSVYCRAFSVKLHFLGLLYSIWQNIYPQLEPRSFCCSHSWTSKFDFFGQDQDVIVPPFIVPDQDAVVLHFVVEQSNQTSHPLTKSAIITISNHSWYDHSSFAVGIINCLSLFSIIIFFYLAL